VSDTAIGPGEEGRLAHLRESELAAFLDGGLTNEERRRVEEHIDVCDVCRAELVDVGRAVQSRRAPGRAGVPLTRRWWLPAAVAAGIVAVLLGPRLATRPRPATEPRVTRVTDGEGSGRIEVVSPVDDATLPAAHVAFAWHAVSTDLYRFSLLSESGDSLWTTETEDTNVVVPRTIQLEPGQAYFWSVDAVANGIVAKTGAHRVQIAR
jgi:Putative zinc-finger